MSPDELLHDFRAPVQLQIDYARELNAQQYAAVTAPPGPSLVIAGAGAGKTRALTYRVAYLLEQGIPSDRILLLTFTNKAAKEMMRRVGELIGNQPVDLWGGTFHSVGYRILRRHALDLGYQPDFTILDRDDSNRLLSACLGEVKAGYKGTRFPSAEVLGEVHSLAANTQKPIVEVLERQFEHLLPQQEVILKIGHDYGGRKRAANVMDFDDLLVLWLRLLRDHSEICERYQRKFQFILVDEYQDTNQLQSDLVDLLAARHRNVMVVGDDSQSIYAWRGANFKNIFEFPKRYPGAVVYRIETNYRSTPEILEVANAAISANIHQFAKQLAPNRSSGAKPMLAVCADGRQQAAFVAQRVVAHHEEGVPLGNIAVLYRSHFHAMELQMEFTQQQIPFAISSGLRFFEQAHIKDVVAYLKLICNPRDEVAFKRIVQMLPGIGEKGAQRLWLMFQNHASVSSENEKPSESFPSSPGPDSISDTHRHGSHISPVASRLAPCASSVPKKAQPFWPQFVETVTQLEDRTLGREPARMIPLILDAGYSDYLKATYENHRNRLEELDQLANFSLRFKSLEEFLAELSLLATAENEGRNPKDDEDRVRLSTIHQAKGLEFDVVFVIMLCDGLFPSTRSLESLEMEEEERRLFYVAITRAKNDLYLSYPVMRLVRGGTGDIFQTASRFLREIPDALLQPLSLDSPYTSWPKSGF